MYYDRSCVKFHDKMNKSGMCSYFKLQDCYENVFPSKTAHKKKTLEL